MAQEATKTDDTNSNGKGKDVSYITENLPGSRVKLEITVEPKRFLEAKEAAYNRLAPETSIQGFRPGKAPRKVIEAKLGARLFEEAINSLIPRVTSEVMMETKFQPLDYAEYKIEKVREDMGFIFTAIFTILPDKKLPDFSKIKLDEPEIEATDKEIDELFEKLKKEIVDSIKNREEKQKKADGDVSKDSEGIEAGEDGGVEAGKDGGVEAGKDGKDGKDGSADSDENNDTEKNKDQNDKDKNDKKEKSDKTSKKVEIDWAEELGRDDVKTENDVKKVIKENLMIRKAAHAEDKQVAELIKKAIEEAEIESPDVLVERQMEANEQEYKGRIEQLGLKVEDFLKTQNTDIETLRKSWKEEAEFQTRSDILFMLIAKENKIQVKDEEIDKEIAKITDEKMKAEYDSDRGRNYIASVLMRQKAVGVLKKIAGIEIEKDEDEKKDAVGKKESKPKADKQASVAGKNDSEADKSKPRADKDKK